MWQNLQFPADLVTFTEEIPDENFFCAVLYDSHSMSWDFKIEFFPLHSDVHNISRA